MDYHAQKKKLTFTDAVACSVSPGAAAWTIPRAMLPSTYQPLPRLSFQQNTVLCASHIIVGGVRGIYFFPQTHVLRPASWVARIPRPADTADSSQHLRLIPGITRELEMSVSGWFTSPSSSCMEGAWGRQTLRRWGARITQEMGQLQRAGGFLKGLVTKSWGTLHCGKVTLK